MQVKESQIQKTILDFIKRNKILCFKHRNVGIYKKATNSYIPLAYGEKGISDIIGCLPDGRFLAIEVKRQGNKPSIEQADFLKRVNMMGGIGFVAYSLDDVMSMGRDMGL